MWPTLPIVKPPLDGSLKSTVCQSRTLPEPGFQPSTTKPLQTGLTIESEGHSPGRQPESDRDVMSPAFPEIRVGKGPAPFSWIAGDSAGF